MLDKLTGDILKQIVPNLSIDRANFLTEKFIFICPGYGINTFDIFQEFLATVIHESCGFRLKEENLNYRTADRLIATWPKHFPTVDFANQYIKNPQKLANYIYGSTSIAKSLGNTSPEDGYNFRGSGFIQITGRYGATEYAKYVGMPTPEYAMNLVRTVDFWALDSACWEFAISKSLIKAAIDDNFELVTKRINGGLIGWQDRQYWYQRVLKYLPKD